MADTTTKPETTAITKAEPKAPLVVGGSVGAIIPQDMEQAWRLAGIIAAANMAPKSYNRDQNAIMVGIMHGMEVGFTPMAALQSIAVINGMPSIWGDGMLAVVRASGLLEDFSESLEGDGEGYAAICSCRRKGQPTMISRSFSVADAKKAKLWSKAGPWQEYPRRMLQMRARSWALRDGFADVLRGMHSVEEVRDGVTLEREGDGTYRARPTRSDYRGPDDEVTAANETAGPSLEQVAADHEGAIIEALEAIDACKNKAALSTLLAGMNDAERDESRVTAAYEAKFASFGVKTHVSQKIEPQPTQDGGQVQDETDATPKVRFIREIDACGTSADVDAVWKRILDAGFGDDDEVWTAQKARRDALERAERAAKAKAQ